nr:DNA-processing protein DprA [Kandeliimicrobium roseum]
MVWLRLLRSRRVGVSTFFRLLRECGSAADALDALPSIARAAGVDDYQPCPAAVAAAELRAGRLAGARLVAYGAPDYPAALLGLSDPPPLLWALGDLALLGRPAVALVGARNASSLGTRMARRLAADLGAAGHVVVSGLARGVDAAAHLGALKTGTIAVMAGGVDVVYPAENAVLAQEIAETGLRLSEQPMGLQPLARHFPRRNRIVSGLSRAVVVVEAAAKSGSLITARDALDQGREVMAVPGHPFDARASGCNMLIRDGALLVRGADDILAALAEAREVFVADAALQRHDPAAPGAHRIETAGPGSGETDAAKPSHSRRKPPSTALRAADDPAPASEGRGPAGVSARPARTDEDDDAVIHVLSERRGTAPVVPVGPTDTIVAGARNGKVAALPLAGPIKEAKRSLRETNALHQQILDRLGVSPVAEDQLIRDLAVPAGEIAPQLVNLELEGRIIRQPGGFLSRA